MALFTYQVHMYTFFDRWTEPGRMNSNKSTKLRGVHHFHHHHHYHHHHHRHDNHHYVLCRATGVKPRLDCRARKQFRRIHFGVFSMSRFVPPALSSNWTWPALSLSSIIRHLSYVRLDRWALLTVWVWYIFIFVLFPLYRSTDLAELWGTVKSCQITQMVEIRYVSQEQDDINCSSMPAGLGGKGKIDRKFEGNFERKWFRMKSAWEEAPKLMSP